MDLLGKKLAAAALMGDMILPAAGALAADNDGNPAVSVTADTLEYNGKTQVATATGNVVIVRDQATMTGNKGVYNLKTSEADMEGKPQFRGNRAALAQQLCRGGGVDARLRLVLRNDCAAGA